MGDNPAAPESSLLQDGPNPLRSETVIRYQIPTLSHVSLSIYGPDGRLVERLAERPTSGERSCCASTSIAHAKRGRGLVLPFRCRLDRQADEFYALF